MERAIRGILREQELRGNIALATFLDELYLNGSDELAEEIEEAMEKYGLSSSTRVDTLLAQISGEMEEKPVDETVEDLNNDEDGEDESEEDDED